MIQRHTGKNILFSLVHLTRRNTRRYGGYLVHIGVVIVFIGLAGPHSISRTSRKWAFMIR